MAGTATQTHRARAGTLGAADRLAGLRARFVNADPELVHLDGSSPNPLPWATLARMRDVVAREWAGDLVRSSIRGWLARRNQFEMGQRFDRADRSRAWLAGTPGILGLAAPDEGVRLVAEAGIDAIRARSVPVREYAIELHDPLRAGMAGLRELAAA